MKKPECKIDSYGTKRWYLNGELHCEDGPAVEWADGNKEWWLNGIYYCLSWWSPLNFAKGFIHWIEAVKESQGKK